MVGISRYSTHFVLKCRSIFLRLLLSKFWFNFFLSMYLRFFKSIGTTTYRRLCNYGHFFFLLLVWMIHLMLLWFHIYNQKVLVLFFQSLYHTISAEHNLHNFYRRISENDKKHVLSSTLGYLSSFCFLNINMNMNEVVSEKPELR